MKIHGELELLLRRLSFFVLMLLLVVGCQKVPERNPLDYVNAALPLLDDEIGSDVFDLPLPPAFSNLTIDGRAVVARSLPDFEGLLFISWRGKGSNFQGFVFIPEASDVNYLPTERNAYGEQTIPIAPFIVDGDIRTVDAEISSTNEPNLFRVSFNLD